MSSASNPQAAPMQTLLEKNGSTSPSTHSIFARTAIALNSILAAAAQKPTSTV